MESMLLGVLRCSPVHPRSLQEESEQVDSGANDGAMVGRFVGSGDVDREPRGNHIRRHTIMSRTVGFDGLKLKV
jgi:hypothetical protein